MPAKYALVSLPLGAFDSSDKDDAISGLSATVSSDNGTVVPFQVPEFKIGTLDALVQQADDLAKLEANAKAVVAKVSDSLRQVLNGDEERLSSYKMVNDSQSSSTQGFPIAPTAPGSFVACPAANMQLQSPPTNTSATFPGTRSDIAPTSLWAS